MLTTVRETMLPNVPLHHRGKVRDVYDLGDLLLIVATDRLSAFDVVLPTAIPGKGVILTGIADFWFARTSGLIANHVVSTNLNDFPASLRPHLTQLAGRSMLVRRAERIDVECVVRGHLAGSAWAEYRREGTVGGEPLPAGLRLGDQLPEPVFTPALKVDDGHDISVSRQDIANQYGLELTEQLELTSFNLFLAASELAAERNLILADSKFEFGLIDGTLTVIDELLTPDSSRYWDASPRPPGETPASFDKQFVRDWLVASGWDKEPPGPELPASVVTGTRNRYLEVYRRLTGRESEHLGLDE